MQLQTRQSVSWMLAFLGLLSSASILFVFYWMTQRIDQAETIKAHELLDVTITQDIETLQLTTADYAQWDLAYQNVVDNDVDAIFDNLGTGATNGPLFDQIFIFGADGQLQHAFDETLGDAAHSLFSQADFAAVRDKLRQSPVADYQTIISAIPRKEGYDLVAATWITPDNFADIPNDAFPAFFGVRNLDAQWREAAATRAQIAMLSFLSDDHASGLETFELPSLRDDQTITLAWKPKTPGIVLRKELQPVVFMVCFIVLSICAAVAFFFRAQHRLLEQATQGATTDHLTGLNNRAGLEHRLNSARLRNAINAGKCAVLFLDLNDFKSLNDAYGHNAGDKALQVTAQRLQSVMQDTTLVARLGGDEFICIVLDDTPEYTAVSLANRIIELTEIPVSIAGNAHVVTGAIGISVAREGTHWETLLSQSDAAMYWSKRKNGQNPAVFYSHMNKVGVAA